MARERESQNILDEHAELLMDSREIIVSEEKDKNEPSKLFNNNNIFYK